MVEKQDRALGRAACLKHEHSILLVKDLYHTQVTTTTLSPLVKKNTHVVILICFL